MMSPSSAESARVWANYFARCGNVAYARLTDSLRPARPIACFGNRRTWRSFARLIWGQEFEPIEENPMLGFRGASRYYDERYQEGFKLECAALSRVREEMGLVNVKGMIPFCRTVEEAERVVALMAEFGLKQSEHELEIYAMCEHPANVVFADEFLRGFDGYSIGSNDLTQLALGLDRDSEMVAHLFDERNGAVEKMVAMAIDATHRAGKKIGICGQAPSDYPEFARFLVERGITSISLNPDTVLKTTHIINEAEAELQKTLGDSGRSLPIVEMASRSVTS